MTDYTLCADRDCRLASTCWRMQARPNKYQSYANFSLEGCVAPAYEHFMSMNVNKHPLVQLSAKTLWGDKAQEQYMQVFLPKLTVQPGWSVSGQLCKIDEEICEVIDAIDVEQWGSAAKEALDAMQTLATLINLLLLLDPTIDLDQLQLEHDAKLERKGYK